MTREQAVNELKVLYSQLWADVVAAKEHLVTTNGTDFAKRTLVRTYFALFEGMSFQFRKVTLATTKGTSILTTEETAMLDETERFLSTRDSLVKSLSYYAKCHRAELFKPDLSRSGWQAMKKAIAMRHRLMHPKSVAHLHLSDKDIEQMSNAGIWWSDSVRDLFMACDESDARFRSLTKSATSSGGNMLVD